MIVDTLTKQIIQSKFSQIEDKEGLLDLINEVHQILYPTSEKRIELKALSYYANPKLSPKRYTSFSIPKKSGGERSLQAPSKFFKTILKCINVIIQCVGKPHPAATGFVPGKSVIDNARLHVGSNYVYNIDLKDFFHSFDRKWVKYGFSYGEFGLHGTPQKEETAFLLACLCTHPMEINGEVKMVLPQGSPTSPSITNILCKKLDKRLTGLANRFGARYSRYADDMTFSSMHSIYHKDDFLEELNRIITDQKLQINPKKTRLQKRGYKQMATGLIINEKVNVSRKYIKELRQYLYYWERYDSEKAQKIFAQKYETTKPNVQLEEVIRGKLAFLKQVKGSDDPTFKKLWARYKALRGEVKENTDDLDLDDIIDILDMIL